MGREIRCVPPNWQHPKDRHGNDEAMLDEHIDTAIESWLIEFDATRAAFATGEPVKYYDTFSEWLSENTPPDPTSYRPWKDEEATWYQVWQTVSEGSPVTPPFATQAELVDYLVKHGEMYGRNAGTGYSNEQAESFIYGDGYVPSMVIADGKIYSGIECASIKKTG